MITELCLTLLNIPGIYPKEQFKALSQQNNAEVLINTKTNAGYSAIYYAVKTGNKKAVKKLVSLGAKLYDRYDGLTLRDIVKQELVRCGNKLTNSNDHKTNKENQNYQEIEILLAAKNIKFNKDFLKKFKEKITELKPNTQYYIIKPMKEKYENIAAGYCFAVASMGGQALHLEKRDKDGNLIHLENFSKRVEYLAETKNDLYHDIELSRHKSILLEELKKNKQEEKIHSRSMQRDESRLFELSDNDNMNLEIDAFLDGIEVFQLLDKQHTYLSSDQYYGVVGLQELKIVSNVALDEQGGSIIVDQFEGDYNEKNSLLELLLTIKKNATGLTYPIVFQLTANLHTVCIGYDSFKNRWHFIDPNQPKNMSRPRYRVNELAGDIIGALQTMLEAHDLKNLTVTILSTVSHAQEIQRRIVKPLQTHKSKVVKPLRFFTRKRVFCVCAFLFGCGIVTSGIITGGIALLILALVGGMCASVGVFSTGGTYLFEKQKAKQAHNAIKEHKKAAIKHYVKNKAKQSPSTTRRYNEHGFVAETKEISPVSKVMKVDEKLSDIAEPLLGQDSYFPEGRNPAEKSNSCLADGLSSAQKIKLSRF